jgi:spermidine synthase
MTVAFWGGFAALGVELAASRLLAPFFGTSLIVWANLIGLILVYLSAGYFLGGRWADRSPDERTLFSITAWAGFAIGIVPFIARPILLLSVRGLQEFSAGLLLGSFVGAVVLLGPPVLLLGCISPFVIRLGVREVAEAGRVSGRVYALSTLGSVLGTFITALALIPNVGTRRTFLFLASTLLALSLLSLLAVSLRRALAHSLLALLLGLVVLWQGAAPIKPTTGLLFEGESAYNYIQVVRRADRTVELVLNEGEAVHSEYNPAERLTGSAWDYFLVVPFFNRAPYRPEQVRRLAVIGLAAGTISREYTAVYGPLPIDGVEIDGDIVELGRRFFAMTEPNLHVTVQDGRFFLEATGRQYDVVAVDAYRQPYIPFHLTTVEFFQLVRDHLTAQGVVAINAGRTDTDYRLVDALAATMAQVFPSVYVIDAPESFNSLVVATRSPTTLDDYRANVAALENADLRGIASRVADHVRVAPRSRPVFTDDRAPVEQLTHSIAFDFLTGRR